MTLTLEGEATAGYSELPLDAASLEELESVLAVDEANDILSMMGE